ncbi:MAG: rod shape-determining protein MreC [Candidatus Binatia bacterium]
MYRFFHRYRVVLSCSFFLVFSLFLATINTRAPHRLDPVGVVLLEVMHPLQVGVTLISHRVEHLWDHYVALWSLQRENDELRRQIADLVKEKRRAAELAIANQRLGNLLDLRNRLGDIGQNAIAARVVGRSPLTSAKALVLDKGTSDGVTKGMAVLTHEGVVGQVMSASPHAARVLLVSDINSAVDAQILRTRVHGIVSGAHEDKSILKYVNQLDDVQASDIVLTSGLDGIFPKGQVIGTVRKAGTPDGRMFQDVEVQLSVDLAKVEEVLVVAAGTLRAAE